jgi:integrase
MARTTERLTALRVQRERRPGMHADGNGLYLRVSKTGARSWVLRYRLAGRRHDMGLGNLDTISLAEARQRAREARKLRGDGIDPVQQKRTQRAAAQPHVVSFAECTESYVRAHRAGWTSVQYATQWRQALVDHVFPVIGTLPVSVIDTPLILKVLEPIWSTTTVTASRVRGRIESILDWAKVRDYRDGENPARWKGHLDQLLAKPSEAATREHYAALSFADMPRFMRELRAHTGAGARALQFTILTAARTGEVRGCTDAEFDRAAAMWTIPASRMTSGREHRVPLSGAALALIDDAVAYTAVNTMTKLLATLRLGLTVHGFRSTFRDWAAESTDFANHVVEQALAHAVSSSVEAAYRRGDLLDKRRALMVAWANFCT